MTRINTNVNSLIAQRVLAKNNDELNTSLKRLSTGLKINSGADNPAGLIASENLRAEKTGISTALTNAERAGNIVATAEGGLSEVSNLLNEIQGLVSETANNGGLSREEKEANQLQVDSILTTINRLSQSVSFQGKKLLNGEYSYTTSGVTSADVKNVRINSARLPDASSQNVVIDVSASATLATVNVGASGGQAANYTIQVAGIHGSEQLSFLSGASAGDIANAVNAVKTVTGVSATVSGTNVAFNSVEYGSDAFVSVQTVSGTFGGGQDEGSNAEVSINGASAEVQGLNVKFRSSNLDIQFDLQDAFNTPGSTSFQITGGGADFALGSKVTEADKASIGIASVSTGSLGFDGSYLSSLASGGSNSLLEGSLVEAQRVVDESIKQVSTLRGRLGAFQKFVIGSTVNALSVAYENVSASESSIRDADFAVETAAMTRSQILAQASTTVLSQANSNPQRALSLLG